MKPERSVTAVVLAAGLGKRMKSNQPKVLLRVLGREMIHYVLSSLHEADIPNPIVVVGHEGQQIVDVVSEDIVFAWQREQLGTGHAVQCALPALEEFEGDVIITCGDTPLISPEVFRNLIQRRREGGYGALVATMILDDPRAYGRIKRDKDGNVRGIVEYRDATERERAIREVNSGTYCFDADALRLALSKLKSDNAQGEFYLTDTIGHLLRSGRSVGAYIHDDPAEFLGINDPAELALAEDRLARRVKLTVLASGVILEEPTTIRIEPSVKIGPRTRIKMGVTLEGNTVIGSDCVIGPHVTVTDAELADGTILSPHTLSGTRTTVRRSSRPEPQTEEAPHVVNAPG